MKEKQEKLIVYTVNQNSEMFRILDQFKQYKTVFTVPSIEDFTQ